MDYVESLRYLYSLADFERTDRQRFCPFEYLGHDPAPLQ